MVFTTPTWGTKQFVSNGSSAYVPFNIFSSAGYLIIDIDLTPPESNHDINIYVYDSTNFMAILENNKRKQTAIKTNQVIPLLVVNYLLNARVHSAKLVFTPPSPGTYYLWLDNTNALVTSKTVFVKAYWMQYPDANMNFLRQTLAENGWMDALKILDKAVLDISYGDLPSACNNIRTALASIWYKVVEKLSGSQIQFDRGKATDIGALANALRNNNVPEEYISLTKQIWGTISELSHMEKRGGNAPPPRETYYAYGLSLNAITYLLSLLK